MAENQYNSKIVLSSGEVLMDLTQDTVVADKLLKGFTAHGKDGAPITGSCEFDADTGDATAGAAEILTGSEGMKPQAKNVTPTFASQEVLPDEEYNCLSSVTVAAIPIAYTDNAQGGKTVTIG